MQPAHPPQHALESAMRRALDLAKRGPAHNTNPQVGCVILSPDHRIVAEGWHRGAGTPHAEVDALAQLSANWHARTSQLTAVVTLEPCNHTGITGPCAEALITAGIGTIAYALADPGAISSGGAERLRAAGITTISGVLEAEARVLLAEWIAKQDGSVPASATTMPHPRPHVIAKWAQTLDGRAAADDGSSQWITGSEARAHVHAERAQADAILVGTGTLIADNPSLTARTTDGELLVPPHAQPVPIVCGKRNIPADAALLRHPALGARPLGGEPLDTPLRIEGTDLTSDLRTLGTRGVRRLYVEGGPTIVSALLRAGLVDELHVYVAPKLLGGRRVAIADLGISSIDGAFNLSVMSVSRLGDDLLITAAPKNQKRK